MLSLGLCCVSQWEGRDGTVETASFIQCHSQFDAES